MARKTAGIEKTTLNLSLRVEKKRELLKQAEAAGLGTSDLVERYIEGAMCKKGLASRLNDVRLQVTTLYDGAQNGLAKEHDRQLKVAKDQHDRQLTSLVEDYDRQLQAAKVANEQQITTLVADYYQQLQVDKEQLDLVLLSADQEWQNSLQCFLEPYANPDGFTMPGSQGAFADKANRFKLVSWLVSRRVVAVRDRTGVWYTGHTMWKPYEAILNSMVYPDKLTALDKAAEIEMYDVAAEEWSYMDSYARSLDLSDGIMDLFDGTIATDHNRANIELLLAFLLCDFALGTKLAPFYCGGKAEVLDGLLKDVLNDLSYTDPYDAQMLAVSDAIKYGKSGSWVDYATRY